MKQHLQGWSLLEMLTVIALMGSVFIFAWPHLQHWRTQWQLRSISHQIQSTLHSARQEALISGAIVTLCVLDTNSQCASQWHQGPLTVFRDPHNERQLSAHTRVMTQLDLPYPMHLSRHPSMMPWLQFSSNGTPRGATGGHIRLCLDASQPEAVRFIIAAGGRSRLAFNQGELCGR